MPILSRSSPPRWALTVNWSVGKRCDRSRVRLAGEHPQVSHHVADSAQVDLDVALVQRAVAAGFGQDRDHAAASRLIRHRARRRRQRRTFSVERHDLRTVEPGQRFALLIELGIAGHGEAGVGPQDLPQIAAVAIDVVLAGADDLIEQRVSQHLRNRAFRLSRRGAVEVEPVNRGEKARRAVGTSSG